MEIQRTNDLVYTPFAMLAADTEKVVNALEDQFLNFGRDNDNTENMARLVWALFSRCSSTLPKKKKDGEQDARKKYEELCKELSCYCNMDIRLLSRLLLQSCFRCLSVPPIRCCNLSSLSG